MPINTTAEFSPDPIYTVNVSPNTFSSNLYIYADGGFSMLPKNFSVFYDGSTWAPAARTRISVDTPIYPYSSNSRYAFDNWSDGTTTTPTPSCFPATSTTLHREPHAAVLRHRLRERILRRGTINVAPVSPTGDGFYPSGDALTFTRNSQLRLALHRMAIRSQRRLRLRSR